MATKITTRVLADNAVTDAKIADVTLTTATQSASDNTTKIATTAYVTTAIANLADSAPSTLNTLNELAAALGDDANFSTTVTNSIATKLPLAGGTLTGNLILGDNVKAVFGAASDAEIYHNGTHLYIDEKDSGRIFIRSSDEIRLNKYTGEYMVRAIADGAVTLYHDNAAKLATTSTGASVTGDLAVSGNVGIGFASGTPVAPLHIQFSNNDGGVGGQLIKNTNTGTTSNFASLSTQAVNGTIQGTFGSAHYSSWGNAVVFAGSQSNHPFKILAGNAVRATFDTSGKVGIGTDAPGYRLHVNDTTSSGAGILLTNSQNTAGTYSDLKWQYAVSDASYASGIRFKQVDTSHGGQLEFYTDNASGTYTERMKIAEDGTTTIGRAITTTYDSDQGYPLHIQAATGNQTYLAISVPGAASGNTGLVIGHDNTGTRITNREADPMIFGISSAEKMRIAGATGNVSIGNGGDANSASRLHVQDTADSQILIYETGSSPYTATLKLASQSVTNYGANVQYTSQAEELTIENFGRALSPSSTSGSIRFRTKVGNSSMTEVMRLQGNTGAVTTPQQPYAQLRGSGGWTALSNSTWNVSPVNSPVMIRNQGGHYSTTNKRFTCPVAGNYMVTVSHYVYHPATSTSGAQYIHPGIYKNGASTWNSGYHPYQIMGHNEINSGTTHFDGVGYSYVIFCAANDYLETRIFASGTNNKVYDQYTYTSYILLG